MSRSACGLFPPPVCTGRRSHRCHSTGSPDTLIEAPDLHDARRPVLPVRSAQFTISGLDHSRMRLPRISTVGLGISGYRLRYVVTLFRCASPKRRATSLASMRSSTSTFLPTQSSLHMLTAPGPALRFNARSRDSENDPTTELALAGSRQPHECVRREPAKEIGRAHV